ncbi:hypothetical protein cypCar_00026640 [Cyprinus carpio]|nr:hypothetical protein cypCar_00026640 [Cyprinus carpio]
MISIKKNLSVKLCNAVGSSSSQQNLIDVPCTAWRRQISTFLQCKGPFSFAEAEHVCRRHGASLAKVGQIYSSWKFQQLDHCDGGWLQDISVRFPIIHPRERCGGIAEPGVPSKSLRPIGAYCYR